MAGGVGERFWPASTPERPKQLLRLTASGRTMLEDAISRLSPLVQPEDVFISTSASLAGVVSELGVVSAGNIIAEPAKRNTAGALVWALAEIMNRYGIDPGDNHPGQPQSEEPGQEQDVSIAVVTADQRVETDEQFRATLSTAMRAAETTGALVTIGIPPTRPETGYGYIEVGDPTGEDGVFEVRRFREKPSLDQAEEFLSQGGFLWNSGMFFWTGSAFSAELEAAAPDHWSAFRTIESAMRRGDRRAAEAAFLALPSISIDYALMEKSRSVLVARAQFEWDDMGSWDALSRSLELDVDGNAVQGDAILLDTRDCVVYSEDESLTPCLLGLEGLVVAIAGGKVVIAPKNRAQDVKLLAKEFESR
ncbi:MAG TPA: sugar phosphate nucleotidyltransferase [Fimbriimonadaceae bacterium]|nr:sugar phosphate nucleotidyltransferase [Fimbriimonadaceae bacterium]